MARAAGRPGGPDGIAAADHPDKSAESIQFGEAAGFKSSLNQLSQSVSPMASRNPSDRRQEIGRKANQAQS
jgi:hypothetical protein